MAKDREYDVIVLGAGAAGLMAAHVAGQRGRRTLVLDHAEAAGKKILISGGGRANFTNIHATHSNYLSENTHFVRSALARYTPQDFLGLVEAHKIPWHEKHLGQLFCDRSARDIVTLLLSECDQAGVRIQLSTKVSKVSKVSSASAVRTGGFELLTSGGVYASESLIVATGGLSIPKMGATGFGYEVAEHFGLEVVAPRPGLVPITLQTRDLKDWSDLAGASAGVRVSVPEAGSGRVRGTEFDEKALITHRGLSGPAVLQISSFWRPGGAITIDLVPETPVFTSLLESGASRTAVAAGARLREFLPARWANRWMDLALPPTRGDLSTAQVRELETRIHAWMLVPSGTEGYAKAEVTVGGISTAELDPGTMESRKVPGLYFVGEVVDVTGWLGGYNFQWAWSSGFCAGNSA